MIGIGSIRLQNNHLSRLRDARLSSQVAEVSLDEAYNGAAQSDGVRLASREQDENGSKVPMHVYLNRAAKFRAELKKKKDVEHAEPECPIEKARSESTTGANTPLNWLVADHFGGETEAGPKADDLFSNTPVQMESSESTAFSLQPTVSSEPRSLLAQEWLLSPCA